MYPHTISSDPMLYRGIGLNSNNKGAAFRIIVYNKAIKTKIY